MPKPSRKSSQWRFAPERPFYPSASTLRFAQTRPHALPQYGLKSRAGLFARFLPSRNISGHSFFLRRIVMLPFKTTGTLSTLSTLSALLLLASCGGGDAGSSSASPPLIEDHPASSAALPVVTPPPEVVPQAEVEKSSSLETTESIALASAFTPLVTGTINGTPYWPEWFGTGKPVAGVNCLLNGNWHRHFLLSIYKDGKRLGLPDGIGRVHAGCYHAYETHVHDVTGIIHMESDLPKNFKLGQWFAVWGQALTANNVAGLAGPARYYIIENYKITPYTGDPALIDMLPHREVLIVTGSQMTVVPKYQWPLGI
jgi:hypothetical protein